MDDLTPSPMARLRLPGFSATQRRLFGYLRPYQGLFVFALVCMVLFGASDGVVPFLVKRVLDGVFSEHDRDLLYLLPVLLLGFAIVRAAADFGQEYLMGKIGHLIVRDIRNELNQHLLTLPPGYFVRNSVADLLSRITSDVVMVRTLLTNTAAAVLRDLVRVIALLIAALYLDPTLALIAFVAFPLGIYPVYRFGKRMRKLSRVGQEAIGALSQKLHESINGNRVVKIFGREAFEHDRFMVENEALTRTFVKTERIRASTGPVNEVLAIVGISAVIIYGGLSVIEGLRTQGDFIAFLISVFLLYDPFKKLSRINNVVQQGVAGAERIFSVLDQVSEIADPLTPAALGRSNEIEFQQVTFAYQAGDEPVLHDISLKIKERARVAVVGFSGAGKSTLIDLIPRFIDPSQGRVLVGGVSVSDVRLDELRSRIAYVGQHTFLFNDTILSNIAYGKEHATREEIEQAAKAAYAYDFVSALPRGFETVVGEAGLNLSGGERQRISIARAILKDAPILILDEATAALDNQSEREVQRALEALEQNRTSIIIAHRLSTVRSADLIVVFDRGRIVEQGTHQELLAKNGMYSRLYELQFAEAPGASTLASQASNQ